MFNIAKLGNYTQIMHTELSCSQINMQLIDIQKYHYHAVLRTSISENLLIYLQVIFTGMEDIFINGY